VLDTIRVLVVDDHPVFRSALSGVLDSVPGIHVVGAASDGAAAIAQAEVLEPDVVVMDLNMPGLDGVEATRKIVHARPQTGVLVLTMFDNETAVFAAMRAGARGYLLKGSRHQQIIRAVQVIGDGEAIFSPAIASRLLMFFGGTPKPGGSFPELTAREREVLRLIALGKGNASIAQRLVLSPKTVRNHVSHIFRKLRVADRAEAIALARAREGHEPGLTGEVAPF
jgi:DNA-binding NarL/FixJ family response regulator